MLAGDIKVIAGDYPEDRKRLAIDQRETLNLDLQRSDDDAADAAHTPDVCGATRYVRLRL
jgi:hypothetical protein